MHVSNVSTISARGLALGLYNTSQSLGLFLGGLLGGLALRSFGVNGIFFVCAALLVFWGMMATGLREIGRRVAPAPLITPAAPPIDR